MCHQNVPDVIEITTIIKITNYTTQGARLDKSQILSHWFVELVAVIKHNKKVKFKAVVPKVIKTLHAVYLLVSKLAN